MDKKETKPKFSKIGKGNKNKPKIEIEKPGGDFLIFYDKPFEVIVLGDALTIGTDPGNEHFGTITSIDFFCKLAEQPRTRKKENFEVKVGGHTVNLTVIDT